MSSVDAFTFTKKSFKRKVVQEDEDSDEEEEESLGDDDETTKKQRLENQMAEIIAEQSSDEDDDDVAVVKKPSAILLLSDDDDDDDSSDDEVVVMDHAKQLLSAEKDSLVAIRKAREARANLARAQVFTTGDSAMDSSVDSIVEADLPSRLGTMLKFNVQVVTEGLVTRTLFNMELRKLEPMQKLLKRVRSMLNNVEDDDVTVVLKHNNSILDTTKTPSSLKLNNNETLQAVVEEEIVVETAAAAASLSQQEAATATTELLSLTLRTVSNNASTGEDIFNLRSNQPFSKLVDLYRKTKKLAKKAKIILKFDGDVLGIKQTPEQLDMETEDIIDVFVK